MTDIISTIQEELRENRLNSAPSQCSEYVARLSGELSFYLARQGELELEKSKNWLEIRKEYKSDNQAEKAYSITPKGLDWEFYETEIKRIKALLTGLKSIIKKCEAEAHNNY